MILIYLQAMECNQENLSQKAWYVLILICNFFLNNSVNIKNIINKFFNRLCSSHNSKSKTIEMKIIYIYKMSDCFKLNFI